MYIVTKGARMNGRIDAGLLSALGSSPQIIDGALTLVEKIRVLEDRRMAAFKVSSVGRRRLLHRIHAEATLAGEPARNASGRSRKP